MRAKLNGTSFSFCQLFQKKLNKYNNATCFIARKKKKEDLFGKIDNSKHNIQKMKNKILENLAKHEKSKL